MLLVLAFPVALSLGILLIPVVSDYSDHAIAAQAVNSTGRWFAGHVLAAVAFGLSVVSVSVAAAVLADREQALPFFVLPLHRHDDTYRLTYGGTEMASTVYATPRSGRCHCGTTTHA